MIVEVSLGGVLPILKFSPQSKIKELILEAQLEKHFFKVQSNN